MQISVSKPDLVRFLQDQVNDGNFHSPEAVVEAALNLLQLQAKPAPLSSETLASIKKSREQLERGEGRDLRDALGELRRKYESR
jgi:Arc/MetJ-type ribon-helix-helix transcriptional regulator